MELAQANYAAPLPLLKRIGLPDWLFAAVLAGGALFALSRYGAFMDGYEKAILVCAVPAIAWLGWFFKPVRVLVVLVAVLSLLAISLYGGSLADAEKTFR